MNTIHPESPKNEIRIAVFGSSFPLGWLVDDEQTLSAHLENVLNSSNQFDRPVRVLNFASASRTGFQFLRGFVCDVTHYKPDVIVAVSQPQPFPNDEYAHMSAEEIIEAARSEEKSKKVWPTPYFIEDGALQFNPAQNVAGKFLFKHSLLVRHIWRRINRVRQVAAFDELMVQIGNQQRENIRPFIALNDHLLPQGIPYIHLVRKGFDQATYKKHGFDRDRICQAFQANLSNQGIEAINGCGYLDNLDKTSAYTSDGHWSSSSNLLFAGAIAEKIISQKDKIQIRQK